MSLFELCDSNLSEKEMKSIILRMYKVFDLNNDGVMSWEEMMTGMSILIPGGE